mmetsp:Transcript_26654/g.44029  ORF Transcript_26654/g.44029 Transcript_26654/m.44029 type:complete len:208 (+) Transcript_26654:981-1604(+)
MGKAAGPKPCRALSTRSATCHSADGSSSGGRLGGHAVRGGAAGQRPRPALVRARGPPRPAQGARRPAEREGGERGGPGGRAHAAGRLPRRRPPRRPPRPRRGLGRGALPRRQAQPGTGARRRRRRHRVHAAGQQPAGPAVPAGVAPAAGQRGAARGRRRRPRKAAAAAGSGQREPPAAGSPCSRLCARSAIGSAAASRSWSGTGSGC